MQLLCPSQLPIPEESQQHLLLTLHFPEERQTFPRDKGEGEIKVLQAFNEDIFGFEEHNSREGTELPKSHKNTLAKLCQ